MRFIFRRRRTSLKFGLVLAVLFTAATDRAWPQNTGPDLRGIWMVENHVDANLERAHVIVDPPDGKIPYRPEAVAKQKENFANRATADPEIRCFQPGVPRAAYLRSPFQIFQNGRAVYIVYQDAHAYRIVYLDGSRIMKGFPMRWAIRAATGRATRWWPTSPASATQRGWTPPGIITATNCTWWSATRASTRTRAVPGHYRRSESVHAALEDPDAASPAEGRSDFRG